MKLRERTMPLLSSETVVLISSRVNVDMVTIPPMACGPSGDPGI
jgi:hypothetical protein